MTDMEKIEDTEVYLSLRAGLEALKRQTITGIKTMRRDIAKLKTVNDDMKEVATHFYDVEEKMASLETTVKSMAIADDLMGLRAQVRELSEKQADLRKPLSGM